jgi:hypothetical protein
MSLLCLNCRGYGWSEAVQEIHELVDLYKPMALFLSETKMSAQRSQDLRRRLGFQNAFGVACSGLSGGLVIMWRSMSLWISSLMKTSRPLELVSAIDDNALLP